MYNLRRALHSDDAPGKKREKENRDFDFSQLLSRKGKSSKVKRSASNPCETVSDIERFDTVRAFSSAAILPKNYTLCRCFTLGESDLMILDHT